MGTCRLSICQSVRLSIPNTYGVPSLCNLYFQKFAFLFIQTCIMITRILRDVHLLFCEHFTTFFSFLRDVDLTCSVVLSKMLTGCLVCVICNDKSCHSFLFKLCIVIVHILKMCTSYLCTFHIFFSFSEGVWT